MINIQTNLFIHLNVIHALFWWPPWTFGRPSYSSWYLLKCCLNSNICSLLTVFRSRQLKTWIHDNRCDLTIKSDTGQHSCDVSFQIPMLMCNSVKPEQAISINTININTLEAILFLNPCLWMYKRKLAPYIGQNIIRNNPYKL